MIAMIRVDSDLSEILSAAVQSWDNLDHWASPSSVPKTDTAIAAAQEFLAEQRERDVLLRVNYNRVRSFITELDYQRDVSQRRFWQFHRFVYNDLKISNLWATFNVQS